MLSLVLQEKTTPKNNQGQLTLKVVRAVDLQETGLFKYQDPFVVIETPKIRLETAVAKGAGSDPEWKEGFELEVTPGRHLCITSQSSEVSLRILVLTHSRAAMLL